MSVQNLPISHGSHDDVTPIIYKGFAIRDEKTQSFNMPYFQTHKAAAMRAFSDLATDQNSLIAKHPSDFKLYEVCSYNSGTGVITPREPEYLATASDFINN